MVSSMYVLMAALAVAAARVEGSCSQLLQSWVDEQSMRWPANRATDSDKLLYFLHVPRTAGRTSHSCFMRPSTPPSRRCAKSYDGFKFDVSVPGCGLFASHDDFSAMRFLPTESAVYTSIRNPVSRFLSAYEFAAELAVREATRTRNRTSTPSAANVETTDVWPWSYLQPFFLADTKARMAEAAAQPADPGKWYMVEDVDRPYYWNPVTNATMWELGPNEKALEAQEAWKGIPAYQNDLLLSLADFSKTPIAQELLHNGQTLQVLGLTNYSHDPQADQLRACLIEDPAAQRIGVDFAKERLKGMMHVGVYERLKDSLSGLAHALGRTASSPTWKSETKHAFSYDDDDGDGLADGLDPAEPFLDPELPQTEELLMRDIQRLKGIMSKARKDAQEANRGEASEADKAATRDRLSAAFSRMSDKMRRLQTQVADLKAGGKIVERKNATGRARQLIADDKFKTSQNVADYFKSCSKRAGEKGATKRRNAMSKYTKPDGRWIEFSKAARLAIPKEVLDEISRANWMDHELHEVASALLTAEITRRKAGGAHEAGRRVDQANASYSQGVQSPARSLVTDSTNDTPSAT